MQKIKHSQEAAYTTFAVVSGVSLLIIAMTTYALRGNLTSMQTQGRAQVKQDYSQKEDAMLSALLHIVPNKAIGAMQDGSKANESQYRWKQIFKEAATLANAEESLSTALINELELENAISGNTGLLNFANAEEFVVAPVHTRDNTFNHVNGGNWWEYYMLGETTIGRHAPAALRLSYSEYLLDKKYPLITNNKQYVSWYQKGLSLSPTLYPDFNLLQYPDIKFGYKRPGELFVAKRNWWVFSLVFGADNEDITGIPAVKKTYALSIYEVPSQIPLSAATLLQLGQHADGSDWENITVDGSVYADNLETSGTFNMTGGVLSAGETMSIVGTTKVDGRTIEDGFDAVGEREKRGLSSQTDFHDASQAGNVGKVAFIPINPGPNALVRATDGAASNRISPTGWNDYSRAANQTVMTLEIAEVTSQANPVPTKIRFTYLDTSGQEQSIEYDRSSNWPGELDSSGDIFPFQTDSLEDGRIATVINFDRIPAYLASLGDAAAPSINNSIYVTEKLTGSSSTYTLDPEDLAVSLRGGKDLTAFDKGLSVVCQHRLYIAESMNTVTLPVPANSGLPADADYYPPLSLFSPEKRFGETLNIESRVNITGQMNSLQTDQTMAVNPLDIKGAGETSIKGDQIRAELKSLRSPAELPPVHQMNWLVTIEEIH